MYWFYMIGYAIIVFMLMYLSLERHRVFLKTFVCINMLMCTSIIKYLYLYMILFSQFVKYVCIDIYFQYPIDPNFNNPAY